MLIDGPTTNARGLLTLLGLKGVGPQTAVRLAARFPTFEGLVDLIESAGFAAPIVRAIRDQKAMLAARDRADEILALAHKHETQVLTITDQEYPTHLRTVAD